MIGSLMMCVGAVVLLVGMLAGIAMGIQQDFALAPAHAHLNLIGGVLLFLFGLLLPAGSRRRDHCLGVLAKVQGWLHIAGAILFPAGVAVVLLKGTSFIVAPIAGSLIVVAAMALFAVIVFRTSRARRQPASSSGGGPLRTPSLPPLFKLIRGIVRETDSPRLSRAQHMKRHAEAIESTS